MPENAQTPTSRVHAVLGVVELEDSLAKKDDTAKLTNNFTHNFDFGNNQKTDLPKRQIIKKLDQPKQTCLKDLLTKWKLFFTKSLDQKNEPILKTYKTKHEQSRRKEPAPTWLDRKTRWIITSHNQPELWPTAKTKIEKTEQNLQTRKNENQNRSERKRKTCQDHR